MISSKTNPKIKHIASLHQTKYRKKHQQFIAEGIRVIETVAQSELEPIELFVTESQEAIGKKIFPNYTLVSDAVMKKISSADTPSGILALFEIPSHEKPLKTPGLVMARIADPGNMGTLIRTAAAMNIKTVVIIEGCDPWAPKVVQSSAGAIGIVSIHQLSWQQLMAQKPQLCALVVKDGKSPNELTLKDYLLVVGSEAHGIPADWLADCKAKLTLPMPGKTESLNAAVAGSIALYLANYN